MTKEDEAVRAEHEVARARERARRLRREATDEAIREEQKKLEDLRREQVRERT